eukprot:2810534-Amphidinium_carterae.6
MGKRKRQSLFNFPSQGKGKGSKKGNVVRESVSKISAELFRCDQIKQSEHRGSFKCDQIGNQNVLLSEAFFVMALIMGFILARVMGSEEIYFGSRSNHEWISQYGQCYLEQNHGCQFSHCHSAWGTLRKMPNHHWSIRIKMVNVKKSILVQLSIRIRMVNAVNVKEVILVQLLDRIVEVSAINANSTRTSSVRTPVERINGTLCSSFDLWGAG